MRCASLLDNWTLQDAFEFLDGELDGSSYPRIKYESGAEVFDWEPVSRDLARFEGFCQLIKHLVLTDEIWVNKDTMQSWTSSAATKPLQGSGIIIGRAYEPTKSEWLPLREDIERRLCWNESLREQFEANKRAFISKSSDADPRLSALVWGGAGMLARAAYSGVLYESHCLRADLFRKSGFLPGPEGPLDHVQSFVRTKRVQLFSKLDSTGFLGALSLPPVVSLVIARAGARDEIIPAALQLRDEFKELRSWLGHWQEALSSEDLTSLLDYQKTLEDVSAYIDNLASSRSTGDTSVQVGVSWLKVSTKAESPINRLKNQYGARAELNKIILSPTGHESIKKLVSLVENENSTPAIKLTRDILSGAQIAQ
ncbi:MAG: hypothetical protein QM790_16175 [Nibricoccus sp.]